MGCSFNNLPEYREARLERKNDALEQENALLKEELAKASKKIGHQSAGSDNLAPEAMAHMLGITVSKAEHFLKGFYVSAHSHD